MRYFLPFLITLLFAANINAQPTEARFYTDLNAALKDPERVIGLDLSHSSIEDLERSLPIFVNLEYLNLSDQRLPEVPASISRLSKLRFLDLSGNDMEVLP
ncbi:MAG: leucine-rich repeat domain-containing protein, partial [Bacteroidetes bacterium]